tara:strand:- start:803 stop:1507 length:705 start_codon:yes stop_codon:yes gene_type:complete
MYRLQKILSKIGYCSRRAAEELILSHKVRVNGKIAKIGDSWNEGDKLEVNNKIIDVTSVNNQKIEVIKYYKPLGEVVSMEDKFNKNSVFSKLPAVDGKWISIGRLDVQTTGLLLFTNNGDFAHKVMHPSFSFKREYFLTTDKILSKSNINNLLNGVPINDNQVGKFEHISLVDNTQNIYKVILTTGKNREIRNSLKYLNIKTLYLHRSRYSSLELEDMREGEYRYLTNEEKLIF